MEFEEQEYVKQLIEVLLEDINRFKKQLEEMSKKRDGNE